MGIFRHLEAAARTSGDRPVDWDEVARAVKASVDPGSLDLSETDQQAYATNVRKARDRIREVSGLDVDIPDDIYLLDRHQAIDTHVQSIKYISNTTRDGEFDDPLGILNRMRTGLASAEIEGSASFILARYQSGITAWDDELDALFFVPPNVAQAASESDVLYSRYLRSLAHYEVAHAAVHDAAPWVTEYGRTRLGSITSKDLGDLYHPLKTKHPSANIRELLAVLTIVAGYALRLLRESAGGTIVDIGWETSKHTPQTSWYKHLGGQSNVWLPAVGERFLAEVEHVHGGEAVEAVLDSPENLPTFEELGFVNSQPEPRRSGTESNGTADAPLDGVSHWAERVDP